MLYNEILGMLTAVYDADLMTVTPYEDLIIVRLWDSLPEDDEQFFDGRVSRFTALLRVLEMVSIRAEHIEYDYNGYFEFDGFTVRVEYEYDW